MLNKSMTKLYAAINLPFPGLSRGRVRDWRNTNDANESVMVESGVQASGPGNSGAPTDNTCIRARD